jgi:hypothetical protein
MPSQRRERRERLGPSNIGDNIRSGWTDWKALGCQSAQSRLESHGPIAWRPIILNDYAAKPTSNIQDRSPYVAPAYIVALKGDRGIDGFYPSGLERRAPWLVHWIADGVHSLPWCQLSMTSKEMEREGDVSGDAIHLDYGEVASLTWKYVCASSHLLQRRMPEGDLYLSGHRAVPGLNPADRPFGGKDEHSVAPLPNHDPCTKCNGAWFLRLDHHDEPSRGGKVVIREALLGGATQTPGSHRHRGDDGGQVSVAGQRTNRHAHRFHIPSPES